MNESGNQPTGAEKSAPLDVSVKITPSKEDGNLLAFANITLGGCFAVRGIRVLDSEKGVFVAMPDKKNAKGEYHDICFPTTAEMRQALNTAVLTEYQKVMEQFSTRGAQTNKVLCAGCAPERGKSGGGTSRFGYGQSTQAVQNG